MTTVPRMRDPDNADPGAFEVRRVPRDGGSLHVRDFPGTGPPFVMMHGLPDTSHIYDYRIPHLVSAGRRVNDYGLAHVQIMGTQTDVSATPVASLADDGMFQRAWPRYRGTPIVNAAFDFGCANRTLREG